MMGSELELCREVESHLRDAEQLMIEAAPGMAERCEARLSRAIEALQRLAIAPRAGRSAEFISGLRRVRRASRKLRFQVQHGNNLCLGWMQLSGEIGYAQDGSPIAAQRSSQMSWEV